MLPTMEQVQYTGIPQMLLLVARQMAQVDGLAIKIFQEISNASKDSPKGAATVSTKPSVAEVFLNGVKKGVTPVAIKGLPVGAYSLMIKTNRYEPNTGT